MRNVFESEYFMYLNYWISEQNSRLLYQFLEQSLSASKLFNRYFDVVARLFSHCLHSDVVYQHHGVFFHDGVNVFLTPIFRRLQETMEQFPLALVVEPMAISSRSRNDVYNNLLLFTVLEDPKKATTPTEMHIFQCVNFSVRVLVCLMSSQTSPRIDILREKRRLEIEKLRKWNWKF